MPPAYLERAARQWAATKPFMPKASELIDLCRSYVPKPGGESKQDLHVLAAQYNARPGKRADTEWYVEGVAPNQSLKLRWL